MKQPLYLCHETPVKRLVKGTSGGWPGGADATGGRRGRDETVRRVRDEAPALATSSSSSSSSQEGSSSSSTARRRRTRRSPPPSAIGLHPHRRRIELVASRRRDFQFVRIRSERTKQSGPIPPSLAVYVLHLDVCEREDGLCVWGGGGGVERGGAAKERAAAASSANGLGPPAPHSLLAGHTHCAPARAPTCRRWPAASPCRTAAPRASRWRTRSWGLRVRGGTGSSDVGVGGMHTHR